MVIRGYPIAVLGSQKFPHGGEIAASIGRDSTGLVLDEVEHFGRVCLIVVGSWRLTGCLGRLRPSVGMHERMACDWGREKFRKRRMRFF